MKNYSTILFQSAMFLLFVVISSACNHDDPLPPTTTTNTTNNQVIMQNTAFNPKEKSVSVGTTVTWTNNDAIQHTVTSDQGLFDSGNINPGGTFQHTFNTPGTFDYHCIYHLPNMTGKIIVTP